jgi:hypothetical protein
MTMTVPLAGGLLARSVLDRPTIVASGLAPSVADGFGGEAFGITPDGTVRAFDGWGNERTLSARMDRTATAIAVDPSGIVAWSVGARVYRRDLWTATIETLDLAGVRSLAITCGATAILDGATSVVIWPLQGEPVTHALSEPALGIQTGRGCASVGVWSATWAGNLDLTTDALVMEARFEEAEEVRRFGNHFVVLRNGLASELDAAGAEIRRWEIPGALRLGGAVGPSQPTVLTTDGTLWVLP